jgi:hypothetical protein
MLVNLVYMENSCYLMSHYKGLMIPDILWQTGSTSYKIEIHDSRTECKISKGTCQFNFQMPPYSGTRDTIDSLF